MRTYRADRPWYYNLGRNWRRRIAPYLADPEVESVLIRDFNKFTMGRWRQPFEAGMVPFDFESCDWWLDHHGARPAYWDYVKHSACHWLVNFALELAIHALPRHSWRIITSQEHSTVWDGKDRLFDFNFQAMGISPDECFRLAYVEELEPGEHLTVHFAEHFTVTTERDDRRATMCCSPT